MKLLASATDVDADDADANANAKNCHVCMGKRSGRFYNVKSYWCSPEQNVGAKKEQRKKNIYEHTKKRKKKIMHKIPATISCACAAFTAIFAPTALITERTI